MIRKLNKKITVLLLIIIGLFSFLLKGPTAHAEVITTKPNWDTSIYDTEWTQAKVKYWNQHIWKWYTPWLDKTRSYIRITDQKGNFINDLTRLEASFKIGGEQFWVNKTRQDGNSFTNDNIYSKDGQLTSYSAASYNNGASFYSHEEAKKVWENYEECNYIWSWNYNIEELIYLYVWYLDPETGKEVAGSFMPDGAHPLYDENGVLKGIYDVDGNPLDDYSLGADGIIDDGNGNNIVNVNDQKKGEIYDNSGFGTASSDNSFFKTLSYVILGIITILSLLIILVLICGLIAFIKKVLRWIKE